MQWPSRFLHRASIPSKSSPSSDSVGDETVGLEAIGFIGVDIDDAHEVFSGVEITDGVIGAWLWRAGAIIVGLMYDNTENTSGFGGSWTIRRYDSFG